MSDLFLDLSDPRYDRKEITSIPQVVEHIKAGLVAAAANPHHLQRGDQRHHLRPDSQICRDYLPDGCGGALRGSGLLSGYALPGDGFLQRPGQPDSPLSRDVSSMVPSMRTPCLLAVQASPLPC